MWRWRERGEPRVGRKEKKKAKSTFWGFTELLIPGANIRPRRSRTALTDKARKEEKGLTATLPRKKKKKEKIKKKKSKKDREKKKETGTGRSIRKRK